MAPPFSLSQECGNKLAVLGGIQKEICYSKYKKKIVESWSRNQDEYGQDGKTARPWNSSEFFPHMYYAHIFKSTHLTFNFSMWQKRVKNLLVQQEMAKTLYVKQKKYEMMKDDFRKSLEMKAAYILYCIKYKLTCILKA